jgi:hypothetical protein
MKVVLTVNRAGHFVAGLHTNNEEAGDIVNVAYIAYPVHLAASKKHFIILLQIELREVFSIIYSYNCV